jgi:hypothetical protein
VVLLDDGRAVGAEDAAFHLIDAAAGALAPWAAAQGQVVGDARAPVTWLTASSTAGFVPSLTGIKAVIHAIAQSGCIIEMHGRNCRMDQSQTETENQL